MKIISFFICTLLLVSCSSNKKVPDNEILKSDFVLAFGSCNRVDLPNLLWDDVLNTKPNVWVWGGDNIYADTDDMVALRAMYNVQKEQPEYKKLTESTEILGTWDDHDYGLNDGGVEFEAKDASQHEFLNFMNVPNDSPLRKRQGVYNSKEYEIDDHSINMIVLDTRYFRTKLTPDTETSKRLKPNEYGIGTMLGDAQWRWLENELNSSKSDFNIIVSSVQYLSDEHGFEAWGNFPHEVDRLAKMISASKAQGVIILSGDRHISEFSKTEIEGMTYPLIDFTSSGLTHAYRNFTGEPNKFRVGEVVFTESFGILEFNFGAKKVDFKIVGDNGIVLEKLEQVYE
ncbi:alkaline phosphatase D family protein [Maribacter hydrothermalis]|uniref:Alkaline phosphatase n=1 Tax=Maribacter hydrothermalis TaxID=1836467 RepID=A0A1B7ZDS0_9FLAO|nr:alkaline phosphatase D family protein [Maribacter hydrothermalis]APQ18441.1 alkaline phosphatase [Maribacter hydrothermalis]OBR41353.1 alkaline phosphatase [Maribacter hydrothermalis]